MPNEFPFDGRWVKRFLSFLLQYDTEAYYNYLTCVSKDGILFREIACPIDLVGEMRRGWLFPSDRYWEDVFRNWRELVSKH